MAAHTCEHDVWIGYKCRLCGGRAKPRPMLAPPPAPMTIHSEDLREKVARIVRYVEMRREKPLRQMDDTIHGIHMGTEWEAELRLSDLEAVLPLLSSIKEGGGEVLSSVGSGLTPLVPSRVPEPGPATPSVDLTAGFVRALPSGGLDDSAFEEIEFALDMADAAGQAEDGRWLTLAERVASLGARLAKAEANQ